MQLALHHETGISGHAKLRYVEALYLGRGINPHRGEQLVRAEDDHRRPERPREVDNDADQLCEELAGVAVEQPGHFAGLPVPAGAIRTVGEEPQGDQPPGTVDTVDGNGAAVVAAVCVGAWHFFSGGPGATAFAQTLEQIQKARFIVWTETVCVRESRAVS